MSPSQTHTRSVLSSPRHRFTQVLFMRLKMRRDHILDVFLPFLKLLPPLWHSGLRAKRHY